MPNVICSDSSVVFHGESDAQCVRWWSLEGEPGDRLEDTGELMSEVEEILGLDR